MRIAIMLRAIDEKGGIGVYTRNIVAELLARDQANEYVLFYRNAANIGRFAAHPNVTEQVVNAPNKAWWDQVAIPLACRRQRVDVLFHPKFTAPLLAPCPVVMTVHGADWFMPDQAVYYTKWDVRYMRTMTPLYFQKCSAVISVSQLTTDNYNQVLRLPPGKIRTIYFAPARHFRRVADATVLQSVQARYYLPDRFILTLTKRLGDGRKNLGQILKAYELYHGRTANPYKLVVGGKDCHLFREEYSIPDTGYGADILFPGWIGQPDLPAVYSLAGLYLYPSNLEAFPIPLTEAMACGTPIVTSNVNGLAEIVGDAAILVDPKDADAIAVAVTQVLSDGGMQARLSQRGLARATQFTWDRCAQQTLDLLERLAVAGDVRNASRFA
jgi:glycosyltransferase involved in cell wall biosynthesis